MRWKSNRKMKEVKGKRDESRLSKQVDKKPKEQTEVGGE